MGRTPKHSRDSLELVMLSVLSDGALYGYQIIKEVAARSDGEMRLTPGVLYPALHDLERGGLILATWEEVRSGRRSADDETPGRQRKWYRLSAKGKRRLAQRVAAHRAYQVMLDAFLPDAAKGEVS